MSSKIRIRPPPFEFSLLLVIVVTAWAGYQLYQTIRDLEQQSAPIPVTQVVPLPPEPAVAHDILRLQTDFGLKEEYLAVADHLATNLPEVQSLLLRYITRRDPPNLNRFRQASTDLQSWIKKQYDRVTQEHLEARSQRLQARIALAASLSSNGLAVVRFDLGTLLRETDRTYSNYVAAARAALADTGRPLTTEWVSRQLESAEKHFSALLELGRQARADERAMDAFLDAQVRVSLHALVPRAEIPPLVPPRPLAPRTLEKILYCIFASLIALCFLFLVGLYRRKVVSPLRMKLAESNTIIEQQKKLEHFGQLAGGLAHEIRNPLTAINARLYTLQKGLQSGSPEQQDSVVIRNEIMRLDGIVRDFLLLARPAEPKLVATPAEPLLKEVADLMRPVLQRQSVALRVDGVVSGIFRADAPQLKQVLINLVRNAAESIAGSGVVTLRVRNDKVLIKEKLQQAVVLEVEDTGSGIRPEDRDRLFDPFFSTKPTGTGLGLAIAARIIDKHGGTLDFETQLGHGTTFRVSLPAVAG